MTKLREKMRNDLRIRNLAENTQKSYLQSVTGLAVYYRRSPDQLSVQEVQDYLLHLSQERHLAWKSVNTIRHGLRFFYRVTLDRPATEFYLPCAKEPSKLPEILSHEELVRLFTATTNRKHRALLMTTYAAGLRASEVTHLRVTDIDSGRMCLRVEQGKGRKDRYVPLAPRLLNQLRAYWREQRPPHWLFPGTQIDQPMSRDGAWHIYVKARDKAGITKAGGLHLLRHCFATHLLEAGTELVDIQRPPLATLDEERVERFLADHGPTHVRRGDPGTCRMLLDYLRELGRIPPPTEVIDDTPLGRIESGFTHYLVAERGLSAATVINYSPTVHPFLKERFGAEEVELDGLSPRDVHRLPRDLAISD